ncbi:class I SAM-dependent methyltransferase [uncultured Thiodictyon sp.]|uniref:class I SAM-dependent methyltransferase n=1 Tax=uncultured Thiodictyon sp. TaxID=1846217 RepID=UPI0025E524AE|nr:class I SAM-dependent methyltransferase [uncultured Thiodictyon sp.]
MTQAATRRQLDWSRTSKDYISHRPGYTDAHFQFLKQLGIGLPGQQILDLGTGTGALALPFARQGARVTAVDAAPGQIASAQARALEEHLDIRFIVSPAEEVELDEGGFDVVTASMSWGYLDKTRIVPLVKRLLRPLGRLLVSSTTWLGDADALTRGTQALIGRYCTGVSGRDNHLDRELIPAWASGHFRLLTYHQYVAALPFTHESWRGRLRASKWIGAALPPEQVEAFDRDLAALLKREAPERFHVDHGVRLQIFQALAS